MVKSPGSLHHAEAGATNQLASLRAILDYDLLNRCAIRTWRRTAKNMRFAARNFGVSVCDGGNRVLRIGAAENSDGTPAAAARDFLAIEANCGTCFLDELHQEIGGRRSQATAAIAGMGRVHEFAHFDH